MAVRAVVIAHWMSQRRIALHQLSRDFHGLVRGIVQQLDVEQLSRVLQLAHRLEQSLDHVLLVENRQLHRHPWQLGEVRRRLRRSLLPVLVIEINEDVPVHSVSRQQDQHDKVWDQQREIEPVDVIQPFKSRIEEMLPDVRTNSFGSSPESRLSTHHRQDGVRGQWTTRTANILPDRPYIAGLRSRPMPNVRTEAARTAAPR